MMQGALQGVKVLEVAEWLAVPSATAMLADWGADVIKVERLKGGDSLRRLRPSVDLPLKDVDAWWEQTNRNKRSIAVDLFSEESRHIVHKLVEWADVFAINFTPPVVNRFHLDYETLSRLNSRLIYAHLTGFGKEGPYKDRPGFDHVAFWAYSGVMGMLGEPGSPPPLQRRAFGDNLSSGYIAGAISAALYSREKTGQGQCIDLSLYHCGVWGLSLDISLALVQGKVEPRSSRQNAFARNPLTNCYQTKDGEWVQIWCVESDRYWDNFCKALSLDEIRDDERFCSHQARATHSTELVVLIDSAMKKKTYKELEDAIEKAGEIIYCRVQRPLDVVHDPQAIANDFFSDVTLSGGFQTKLIASPARFSRTPAEIRKRAPALSENAEEVLLEVGYSLAEIGQYRKRNIIV
jgi:crotonobetainyl-CoA:carnitine CoA-transferase CaiB-like acyl-CoA transferase